MWGEWSRLDSFEAVCAEEASGDSYCGGRKDCLAGGAATFSLVNAGLAAAVKAGMKGATAPGLGLHVSLCMEKQRRKIFLRGHN